MNLVVNFGKGGSPPILSPAITSVYAHPSCGRGISGMTKWPSALVTVVFDEFGAMAETTTPSSGCCVVFSTTPLIEVCTGIGLALTPSPEGVVTLTGKASTPNGIMTFNE